MWNRIAGPKGFDADAVLPYRERLIVCYIHKDRKGVGEAYVDEGIWYWWDSTNTNSKVRVQESYQLIAWTPFPNFD